MGSLDRKYILLPGNYHVDITDFIQILSSPVLQRLRFVKQLGNIFRIFPGAVHTRFEHSLGTLYWTTKILERIKVDERTFRLVRLYAILHDIGHGPFSHEIEPLLGSDHNIMFFNKVLMLKKEIESTGISINEFISFAEHSPFIQIVRDRNIGADKLDYMLRDALHIGFAGSPDPLSIIQHTLLFNNQYVIDEKAIENIKMFQLFYSYLHKNGYLNKTSLMIERMFARLMEEILTKYSEYIDDIWNMNDTDIDILIRDSDIGLSKDLYKLLNRRQIFLSSIVIRMTGYEYQERVADKPISVYGLDIHTLDRVFNHYLLSSNNRRLENRLAEWLDIPEGFVLIAFSPHLKRLLPKDSKLYRPNGSLILSLEKSDPMHYDKLISEYYGSLCIRIGSLPEYRSILFKRSDEILNRILDYSKNL